MREMHPNLPDSGREYQTEGLRLVQVPAQYIPEMIRQQCAPCDMEAYGEGQHSVWFLPEASAELDHITGFGKKRAFNAYELTYLGLGRTFQDERGRIQTVVSRVLPICSASRGPVHAQVISEGNDSVLDNLERERQIQNELERSYNTDENGNAINPFLEYGPSEVVLFGHTHPNLGCFFSSTDRRSNYSTPAMPIVTFVCDPIQRDMKAMVGVQGADARIYVCRPRTEQAVFQRPTPHRNSTVEDLWRRVCNTANVLLQQKGIKGSFDCYHDWKGNTHMEFHIIARQSREKDKH